MTRGYLRIPDRVAAAAILTLSGNDRLDIRLQRVWTVSPPSRFPRAVS